MISNPTNKLSLKAKVSSPQNKLRPDLLRFILFGFILILGAFGVFAQINHVNTQVSQVSTKSMTINRPIGLSVDDLMIVNINIREGGSSPSTVPTGWKQIENYNLATPNRYAWIAYKAATQADVSTSSYTFQRSGVDFWAGAISAFRNVDINSTNGSVEVIGNPYADYNSNPILASSITTISTNSAVIFLAQ